MRDSKLDSARTEYKKRLNRYLLKSSLFIIFVLAPFGFALAYLKGQNLIDSGFYYSANLVWIIICIISAIVIHIKKPKDESWGVLLPPINGNYFEGNAIADIETSSESRTPLQLVKKP